VVGGLVALVLTAVPAALGFLLGGGLGDGMGRGVGLVAGALVGGVPGAILGWAVARWEPYDVRRGRGLLAALVDVTWSLPNTWAGAVFLGVNLLRGNRVEPSLTRHAGAVHLVGGVFPPIAGVRYVTTIGTVIAGVAPAVHRHEHGHILQARLFGPLYLPLVAAHYVVATVVPYWWLYHDHERYPITDVGSYLTRGVYHHVWHEEWCYRRYGPPR
jgi:hypothetical protein